MKPYVRCYYQLARYAVKLYRVKNVQGTRLKKELAEVLAIHGFTLSESHKKRIGSYLIQSCITNEWFSLLRGYSIAKNELQASLYIGAITPIVDDLMDNDDYSGAHIQAIYRGELKARTADEHLLYYGYQKLLTLVNNPEYFVHITDKIAVAQDNSRSQKKNANSLSDLETYTRNKGGLATLFYRSILSNKPSNLEAEVIILLGELLQWVNDVFGVYNDKQQGIETPATAMSNFVRYDEMFHQKLEALKHQLAQLPYALKNKNNALISIMQVLMRGEVCIHKLVRLQGDSGHLEIEKFSRKELLCDMENASNFYKSIRFTLKFNYINA